jgi:hypothetical protein
MLILSEENKKKLLVDMVEIAFSCFKLSVTTLI